MPEEVDIPREYCTYSWYSTVIVDTPGGGKGRAVLACKMGRIGWDGMGWMEVRICMYEIFTYICMIRDGLIH